MQISDFMYDLPPQQIAQFPNSQRTASRLLGLTAEGLQHGVFSDIGAYLCPGDLLVLNNTKVVNARLFARKDSGGQAEVLFERLLSDDAALCQVRVSKPLKPGRILYLDDDNSVSLTCVGREGQFYHLQASTPFLQLLETYGHVPLPPYIERADDEMDQSRYQTVYGQIPGAVAAPTAGLHFSRELLDELQQAGIERAEVTLHVGAGTFQPVRGELDKHVMHQEFYNISEQAAAQIAAARAQGRRVVAVGTTVVRTLESAAIEGQGQVCAGSRETQLFIKPGFQFQVVDALITNFHLPGSTLMMLVCAFGGYQAVMSAYKMAVANGYRFFSYGDAMWIERQAPQMVNQQGDA